MILEKENITTLLERLPQRRRTPLSTYRLQLHRGFGFKEASALVPYFADIGITDCYTSSILKARPGSTHGYDICDHNALNPDLGSEGDYEHFAHELKIHHMGHILDFVPNHMGIDPETNPWWRDVLENGPSSAYAHFFDIHWNAIKPELRGKILLPILGDQYGEVLERGEIQLVFEKGVFKIHYFDQHLPTDPKQYPSILRHDLEVLKAETPEESQEVREYLSILTAFENLPLQTESQPERRDERRREKTIAQERLARLTESSNRIREHIRRAVNAFNGQPGQSHSFDALHTFLEAQAYRLAYWKTALHEINYRRFFDINSLAGLRVENAEVFPLTHQLVLRLLAEDKITGLRIDHPDGLYDPAAYFETLQDAFLQAWIKQRTGEASQEIQEAIRAWRVAERKKDPQGLAARPLYIVAEKILSRNEVLDPHWMIDGTSGYDYLNQVNRLFIQGDHSTRLHDIYLRFTGQGIPFETTVYICKKLIMSTSMASELNMLAYSLDEITERDRHVRDFTLDSLRDALKEVIACFPVYRTYINVSRGGAADREIIERAIAEATGRNPALESSIFEFIRSVLTHGNVEKVSSEEFYWQLRFTMKFQQYTAPVQAKGVEDTAFYRYVLLSSLNEVGSDPREFGSSVEQFHQANQGRQASWRHAMLATSTHDTKRGEDARARINVLSEIPDEWENQVMGWAELNQIHRTLVGHEWAPSRNEEYLFYQTLLGAWEGETTGETAGHLVERMRDYMLKALREAKVHTSWMSPHEDYEKAVAQFVERTLTGEGGKAFFAVFVPFAQRVAKVGRINSLSQLILKMTSPGIPDFYQGSELWDLNLVDPDNRREVDYHHRQYLWGALKPSVEAQTLAIEDLLAHGEDGQIKMAFMACGLRFRQQHPELFLEGTYMPLRVEGALTEHLIAFARSYQNQILLTVVPRFVASWVEQTGKGTLPHETWKDTYLKLPETMRPSHFRSILTSRDVHPGVSGRIPLADLLADSPIGLFYTETV